MSKSLEECWAWIDRAIKENWIHARRGTRMKDASLEHLLIRIMEETGELSQAHTRDHNDLEEIADCFAILTHYAIAKGFSQEQVCAEIMRKLEHHIWAKDHRTCVHGLVAKRKSQFAYAYCPDCGKYMGWWCPSAPRHFCEYDEENDPVCDTCLHCGEPEERK